MMIKRKNICIFVCLLFVIGLIGTLLLSDREIVTVNYTVQADLEKAIRIVHLTDLHGWEFGEGNQELAELVAAQEPDLILMTGDMLDRADENAAAACELIEKLAGVAPVYYGYGNHETAWERENGKNLEPELTAAGAVVLDWQYTDITVKDQSLRLGGYHGYYRRPHMHLDDPAQKAADTAFCDAFEDTDRFKILLCHIPTAWLDWGMIDDQNVDLVLTGHYHGGQIRLPLVGGIYAPYVGFFPPYTEGVFEGKTATAVLSTGLGSSPGIPRINNPPQMVVVDLTPKK